MRGMGVMPGAPMRGMGGMPSRYMGKGIENGQSSARKPFLLSGAFSDATLDGWTGNAASSSYTTAVKRSLPGALVFTGTATRTLSIPASVCRGSRITVSVWHRGGSSGASFRAVNYSIAGGSQIQLDGANDTSATFTQFLASFDNPGKNGVNIVLRAVLSGGNDVYFDDWEISGVPL